MQMPNPTYIIALRWLVRSSELCDIYFAQSFNVSGYKSWPFRCPILVGFVQECLLIRV